ncbi:MAG: DUF29 domain-containing protein [Rhodospirillaceae bacterium]
MISGLYERDFHAWAMEQAGFLRAGNYSAADIAHIAEEIESMGRTEKRELVSRLAILLCHLLKWRFQPGLRGNSWRYSIIVQRRDLARHLADNPSLKAKLGETLADAYINARYSAAGETELPEQTFPTECPWPFERIMNAEFWPED